MLVLRITCDSIITSIKFSIKKIPLLGIISEEITRKVCKGIGVVNLLRELSMIESRTQLALFPRAVRPPVLCSTRQPTEPHCASMIGADTGRYFKRKQIRKEYTE